MKPNELLGVDNVAMTTQKVIKTELDSDDSSTLKSSPATEALEMLMQSDEANSLMFDLAELLKRDPTLSSLADFKSDSTEGQLDNVRMGASVPIPVKRQATPENIIMMPMLGANGQQVVPNMIGGQNVTVLATSGPFGQGSSGSSNISPLASSSPSMYNRMDVSLATTQSGSGKPALFAPKPVVMPVSPVKAEMMDYNDTSNMGVLSMQQHQPTLAELNSSFSNDSSNLLKLELNDLDVDLNDYFTTDVSKDVSLGAPYHPQSTTSAVKTESAGSFWQQDDSMLFSSSSMSGQTGGATFSSKDLLSSSVPATIFQNSPLSDILTDLPASPVASAVSPNPPSQSPSHAGPERHHGASASTLHRLLLKKETSRPSPVRSPESRKTLDRMRNSLSATNPLLTQQLSKSAPAQPSPYLDRMLWAHREPRQHISSVCSVGDSSIADEVSEALSGISPNELPDIESDDEEGSQMDEEDGSSDDDDSDDDSGSRRGARSASSSGKKERHFWQYNVQAKGPKGQKIVVETKIEDPHVLNEIVDPVFSGDVQLQGIKHSGKARRGDGNDLNANPKKLAAIGRELDQLNKVITDLTPVSEMPFNSRCKSRKEKNKLASRACRLKKKAQHEANKLKLHGLEEEHHELSCAIDVAKAILRAKVSPGSVNHSQMDLTTELDNAVKKAFRTKVAGQTSEYVNRQIEKFLK